MKKASTLFRPAGWFEMQLIKDSGMRKFPPRLEWQPILHPVLCLEYARQIALDWNTNDPLSGYIGYVTQFNVDITFVKKYSVQNVGASHHNELWIPAEDMDLFNQHIIGNIEVLDVFYGENYSI